MVDPIAIVGLTVTVGTLLKSLYGLCNDFATAYPKMEELCQQLCALQEVLGRVSSAVQFAPEHPNEFTAARFTSDIFEDMIRSTEDRIKDLQSQLPPPGNRTLSQSAKLRFKWIFNKGSMQECIEAISQRRDYFSAVLSSENNALSQTIYGELQALKRRNVFEVRKDLRVWLGSPDYYAIHALYLNARQPGTGYWFMQGPFAEWWASSPGLRRILWLQGKSGCGKSLLTSYTIERTLIACETHPQVAVLYFHCTSNAAATLSAKAVVSSFLQQLCEKRPELWERLHSESQKAVAGAHENSRGATFSQLQKLLLEFVKEFSNITVFLDAPNESPQADAIISTLTEIMRSYPPMRLCISSTPDLSMGGWADLGIQPIQFDAKEQVTDFKIYIESSLQRNPSLATLPEDLKILVVRELLSKADGSFQWVEEQLKSLAEQDSPARVKEALKSLPSGLNKHYRERLAQVPPQHRLRVRRLLRWMAVQFRPMTILELSEAVILASDSNVNVIPKDERVFPGMIEQRLRDVRTFVEYSSVDGSVGISHSSHREFLLSPTWQSDKDIQDLVIGTRAEAMGAILSVCLWYLLQEPFQNGTATPTSFKDSEWHLLDYCVHAWPSFVEMLADTGGLGEAQKYWIQRFMNSYNLPNGGNYAFWLQRYAPEYLPKPGQNWKMLSPLHLAAGRGWLPIVQVILSQDRKYLNGAAGVTHLTPLLRACCYRQTAVVEFLLSAGADPTLYGHNGQIAPNMFPEFRQLIDDTVKKRNLKMAAASSPSRNGSVTVARTTNSPVRPSLVSPIATPTLVRRSGFVGSPNASGSPVRKG